MARKKMTTYVDEELLRSAKILAAKRDDKIYEVFEDALISLRYHVEETGGPEASREERAGNGTYEEHQPRPRTPLLSGGKHPTLGERFKEELHRS